MIKVNDIVWVNESTISGKPLKHEWYGEVIKVKGEMATIRDTGFESYHGEIFTRMLTCLEIKEG